MYVRELFARPDLEWREPPGFREDCLGIKGRVDWAHHLLFLVILLTGILYLQGYFGQHRDAIVLDYLLVLTLALSLAYGQWFVLKHQALPARIAMNKLVSIRVQPGMIFPAIGILKFDLALVPRARLGRVICGDKEFDYLVLIGKDGTEGLRVGLDSAETRVRLAEMLEERGILEPCGPSSTSPTS